MSQGNAHLAMSQALQQQVCFATADTLLDPCAPLCTSHISVTSEHSATTTTTERCQCEGQLHLAWIELEVLHESFQTKALVAHIHKDIPSTIEGTEGQGCIHQLLLYCDGKFL